MSTMKVTLGQNDKFANVMKIMWEEEVKECKQVDWESKYKRKRKKKGLRLEHDKTIGQQHDARFRTDSK